MSSSSEFLEKFNSFKKDSKKKNVKEEVHPSHPNTYSCFEHGSEDDKIYDCTYNDFKTIYFTHRFSRSPSRRQKETIVTIPYYIPKSLVSTYLAIYFTGKPWTRVNIQDRIPRYSEEWQPLINEGKCYLKS